MAGTLKRSGPAYLSNAAADVLTTPASGIYNVIRHIHLDNVTSGAVTFTLYIGTSAGSAGGTELFKEVSIPANSSYDYYTPTKQVNTEYLSGLASAASSIVSTIDYEQYVV